LRLTLPDTQAFGSVFLLEAGIFIAAALMAAKIMDRRMPTAAMVPGE